MHNYNGFNNEENKYKTNNSYGEQNGKESNYNQMNGSNQNYGQEGVNNGRNQQYYQYTGAPDYNNNNPSFFSNVNNSQVPNNHFKAQQNESDQIEYFNSKELYFSLRSDSTFIDTFYNKDDAHKLRSEIAMNNKLLSQADFSQLNIKSEIKKALYQIGYDKPSIHQLQIIPHIIGGESLMFQSKSGTGKTISYVVGTLENVKVNKGVQIILVTPTMELNKQTANIFERVGEGVKVKTFVVLRGENEKHVDAEVLVGSPGSILKMIRNLGLREVHTLILDEADVLLDKEGLGSQTKKILEKVNFSQYLFFSATYNTFITNLIKKYVPNVKEFLDNTDQKKPEEIKMFHLLTKNKEDTLFKLYDILSIGQSIIFVSTKRQAEYLTAQFRKDNYKVSFLHGGLTKEDRSSITEDFRTAKTKVLITTDVFSRGMDIAQVNLVINYDLPVYQNKVQVDTYIHRIGRCGRFGREGFVIDLLSMESDCNALLEIQKKINCESKRVGLDALMKVASEN